MRRVDVDRLLDRLTHNRRLDRVLRSLPDRLGEPVGLWLHLRWQDRHDAVDRSGLRPPDDEKVKSRIVWVAEAYAPSDVPQLLAGLNALGLDRSRLDRKISDSVVSVRRASGRWSHQSLAMIRRPGEGIPFFDQVEAELPNGVVAALPGLHLLPGSVSLLVLTFLMDAESAARVDDVLRQPHRTTGRRTRSGWSFHPPEMTQRDAVGEVLAAQRTRLAGWTADRFGGAFARRGDRELPTAQLLTYRTAGATSRGGWRDWPQSVEVQPGVGDWRSERWPVVRMHRPRGRGEDDRLLRLSAREQALRPQRDESGDRLDDDDGWWLLFQQLQKSFEGLVALHTLSELVDLYTARLSDLRDAAIAAGDRPRQAARRIASIRRDLEVASDARAVASDLQEETPSFFFSAYDGGDWIEQLPTWHPRAGGPRDRLISGVASQLPTRARAILDLEHQIRERLATEAQLMSAAAGLRLQRYAFWIATLALIAAVVIGALSN